MASISRRRSISNCVKTPSPDQFDVSVSSGMVNGHQPAEDAIVLHTTEAMILEHTRHRRGAGIVTNRRRDIAIGVWIAMQDPTERRADDGQIREVGEADPCAGRPVEIERNSPT